ncbi:hypothetical protein LINPERHAP1_LOCUS24544 [Linum perenne]
MRRRVKRDIGPTWGACAPKSQDGSQNPNTNQVKEDVYQAKKKHLRFGMTSKRRKWGMKKSLCAFTAK